MDLTHHTFALTGPAQANNRPSFLMKREFLAFTLLRAYPHLQMRKLMVALRDRLLPLKHDAVHTLIRQTLYQLGPAATSLAPGDHAQLLWKTDLWLPEVRGFDEMAAQLRGLAAEYAQKPRDAHALLIVSEMAAYVAQWQPNCSSICLDLAHAAQQWSDELTPQLAEASRAEQESLRKRQCLFSMYALFCCATVRALPTETAVRIICRSLVTIQSCLVLSEPPLQAVLSLLAQAKS